MRDQISEIKKNSRILSSLSNEGRDNILLNFANKLIENKESILSANKKDIELSKGLSESLIQRLKFNEEKLLASVAAIHSLISLPSYVNKTLQTTILDEGLVLNKVAFPLGVIAMIYEARPDAGIQMLSLSIKSGNGLILKGGKEAKYTNKAIFDTFISSLTIAPCALLLETHLDIAQIFELDDLIDLLIPRGSNSLVMHCMKMSKIPVLGHADGRCHVYIDANADLNKALDICLDSKINYPSACNAAETILVHENIAKLFIPEFKRLCDENNVIINGCENTRKLIAVKSASEESYYTEYSALELNIKIVDSLDAAIEHINKYSSSHTDCIVSSSDANINKFFTFVDSADVFANASTRFADGFRFGLGAEVGISTSKLHARGPVGLEGLCTTKYLLSGNGQIVKDYQNGKHSFKHEVVK